MEKVRGGGYYSVQGEKGTFETAEKIGMFRESSDNCVVRIRKIYADILTFFVN